MRPNHPFPCASHQSTAARVRTYIDTLVNVSAQAGAPVVSVILFGSAAAGGFSDPVSDVDLIVVLDDDATPAMRRRLSEDIVRLERAHGLRPASAAADDSGIRRRIERAVGHGFSGFVCTRSDLISGDVARVLSLSPLEKPFVDRIVFASIIASAATVSGEDLLPNVPVLPVRRLDVLIALFGLSNQVVLSALVFPVLHDATRYAMGALKHSLHSCYFCYHGRTAALGEEVAFFSRRMRATRTLLDLLALRGEYRHSFGFVMRTLATVVRLHVRTALDNQFPIAVVRDCQPG